MLNIRKIFLISIVIYHFSLEREREKKKKEKCNKLVCNIHGKENYVVHIRALKQALNNGLILKKYIKYINLIKKHS